MSASKFWIGINTCSQILGLSVDQTKQLLEERRIRSVMRGKRKLYHSGEVEELKELGVAALVKQKLDVPPTIELSNVAGELIKLNDDVGSKEGVSLSDGEGINGATQLSSRGDTTDSVASKESASISGDDVVNHGVTQEQGSVVDTHSGESMTDNLQTNPLEGKLEEHAHKLEDMEQDNRELPKHKVSVFTPTIWICIAAFCTAMVPVGILIRSQYTHKVAEVPVVDTSFELVESINTAIHTIASIQGNEIISMPQAVSIVERVSAQLKPVSEDHKYLLAYKLHAASVYYYYNDNPEYSRWLQDTYQDTYGYCTTCMLLDANGKHILEFPVPNIEKALLTLEFNLQDQYLAAKE